ncbi:TetR/AcrR family transcriptional regulator [Aestuariivirga sp.]|uniref:TetR/AcrR family transcriptional regulator n=1 Tax=Aestuariivirga sp. TaxID=2650926 RepID=UPI0039E49773
MAAFIVRQARALFLERGYARTTMDDLAAYCRMSKSTLYRLFDRKADVFAAIVEDHRHSMLALPGNYKGMPLEEALARIFYVGISDEDDRKRLALIRLVVVEARELPELHDILVQHGVERDRHDLAQWLEGRIAAGEITACDTADCAKALMDLMFGAVVMKPHEPPKWPDRQERIRYQLSCLRMFVSGLLPR